METLNYIILIFTITIVIFYILHLKLQIKKKQNEVTKLANEIKVLKLDTNFYSTEVFDVEVIKEVKYNKDNYIKNFLNNWR